MTRITLSSSSPSAHSVIKGIEFFSQTENVDKVWLDTYTFREFDQYLRFLARNLGLKIDSSKADFEEVAAEVAKFFSQNESVISSEIVDQPLLEEMVRAFEESVSDDPNKPEIFRQRASEDVKSFIERQRRLAGFKKAVTTAFSQETAFPPPEKVATIAEHWQPEADIILETQKSPDTVPQETIGKWHDSWQHAVEDQAQATGLTPEEKQALKNIGFSPAAVKLISQSPGPKERADIVVEQTKPLDLPKAEKTIEILSAFIMANPTMVETGAITDTNLKEVIITSLAIAAEELHTQGIELTPQEINTLETVIASLPETKELLSIPTEEKLDQGVPLKNKTVFLNPKLTFKPSPPKPFSAENSKGLSFVDALRQTMAAEGINSKSLPQIKEIVEQVQTALLVQQGITAEDLKATAELMIQNGADKNSPAVIEINKALGLLEKAVVPPALASKDPDKLMVLPLSQFQTVVHPAGTPIQTSSTEESKTVNNSVRIGHNYLKVTVPAAEIKSKGQISFKKLISRIFPARKTVSSGAIEQKAFVQALSLNFPTVFGSFKGVPSKFSFRPIRFVTRIFKGVDLKINLGPTIIKAGSRIGDGIGSILSGRNQNFNQAAGSFKNLLSSLTSPKIMTAGVGRSVIIMMIAIIGLPLLIIMGIGGAFSGSGQGSYEGTLPPMVEAPLNCLNTRHLSESVICTLSQGDDPCNHNIVERSTWPKISACFNSNVDFLDNNQDKNNKISQSRKEAIKTIFSNSVASYDQLQCVGFVVGIEAGRGKNAQRPTGGNARDYLKPPYPDGYEFVNGIGAQPEKGWIAIWYGTEFGHMAEVVEVVGNSKLIVAQAWGGREGKGTGIINLTEVPFGSPEIDNGSPGGFLKEIE